MCARAPSCELPCPRSTSARPATLSTLPQLTSAYGPCCPDGPRLPSEAEQSIRLILERIIREEAGHCALHDEQKLSSGIVTHELLVLASNTVSAVCDVGQHKRGKRPQFKLLAKLLAAAIGGTIADDPERLLAAGKRLDRQADRVREASSVLAQSRVKKSRACSMTCTMSLTRLQLRSCLSAFAHCVNA